MLLHHPTLYASIAHWWKAYGRKTLNRTQKLGVLTLKRAYNKYISKNIMMTLPIIKYTLVICLIQPKMRSSLHTKS